MRLKKSDIIKALEASHGLVGPAAKLLACSRQALYQRLQADPELEKVLRESREQILDLAESRLFKLVENGNLAAVTFVLRTIGKSRGYGERIEAEHGGGVQARIGGVSPAELAERLQRWLATHCRK